MLKQPSAMHRPELEPYRRWSEKASDGGLVWGYPFPPALVVGNGMSRIGRDDKIQDFRDLGGIVFACNSYWRHTEAVGVDFLVCWDLGQTRLALESTDYQIIIHHNLLPHGDPRFSHFALEEWDEHKHRLIVAEPYDTRMPANNDWDGWHPRTKAFGNLSGLLAFQAAWLMGARSIFLLGIDSCGIPSEDAERVQLSACDSSWDGYTNQELPAAHCREVGDHLQPKGWSTQYRAWRSLTDVVKRHHGIHVYRLVDEGALTWLPVRANGIGDQPHCQDRGPT